MKPNDPLAWEATMAADPKTIAAELRRIARGRAEWRVADPDTGAYCIAFDADWQAHQWLAEHVRNHPTSMHANKVVKRVHVLSELERAGLAAAQLLDPMCTCRDGRDRERCPLHEAEPIPELAHAIQPTQPWPRTPGRQR